MKRLAALLILICLIMSMGSIIKGEITKATVSPTLTLPPVTPPTFEPIEPKLEITYQGATPLSASLAAKADKRTLLRTATVTAMAAEKYPLVVSSTVTIDRYRCDDEKCGYWITASRGGRPVAVNNPIWLVNGNAPYHTVVSEYMDTKTNTQYVTVREDVKGALIQILTDYADRQPIGAPKVGTKE
jgi:hypothetical protein